MILKLKNKLNEYRITRKCRIIVSISGGIDSVVLLDALKKLDYKNLYLVHFNYRSHQNSDFAKEFVENYSLLNNHPYKIYYPLIPNKNFENLARFNRYDLLSQYKMELNCDFIFTAHHYDDQVETLIMKDGENADWISYLGIRERYGSLIRPLLNIKKNDIYKYAIQNKLVWFEDSTNNNLKYLRNDVRNKISNNYYKKEYISNLFMKHNESKRKLLEYEMQEKQFANQCFSINDDAVIIENNITDYFKGVYLKLLFKKIISTNFNVEITKTYKFWLLLYDFFEKSNLGNEFVLCRQIILKRERTNFIIYDSKDLDIFLKIKINGKTNWNNTFFSTDDLSNDLNCIDMFKCPNNIIKSGLYVTNWIHGDTIKTKSGITKKVSDIFINQKFSYYAKKKYPIVRNKSNEIVWIPNLESEKFDDKKTTNIYWMKNV